MKTQYTNFKFKDPQLLSNVLDHHPLSRVLAKAKSIHSSNMILVQFLPKEMVSSCKIINIEEKTLTLEVANAAWATRLRFLESSLLPELRRYTIMAKIENLQYRVRPQQPAGSLPPTPKTLSNKSRTIIQELADSLSFEKLKNSLLKLIS